MGLYKEGWENEELFGILSLLHALLLASSCRFCTKTFNESFVLYIIIIVVVILFYTKLMYVYKV
jgi:prepilin signal peptidase PulO-like enzyme (type II secretory pathway)